MSKRLSGFYAYPSRPPSIGETVEIAIAEIAKTKEVNLRSWRSLRTTGKLIIDEITEAIGHSAIFACDLTYTNFNVLFELGYAVGQCKRVWISLNTTIQNATKSYEQIHPTLVTTGYAGYQNHQDLVDAFRREHPWTDPKNHLLGQQFRLHQPRVEDPALLYLKAPMNTQASITLSEILAQSPFANGLLVDDPKDNPAGSLLWYADKILDVDAVLAHILSTEHTDTFHHNAKCSFVCGLARGLGRLVFLLAHEPFDVPLDYRNILAVHPTADACRNLASRWIEDILPTLPQRRRRRPSAPATSAVPLDLRHISLGEPVAELERDRLDDYFIETSAYYQALDAQTTIFVGRRGTGKTATFFALDRELSRDVRNHVCRIKPVGYEVDGLVRVLRENLQRSERGYLIESLWKFLIYSDLACSVADTLAARPPHYEWTDGERRLAAFVAEHADQLRSPFSVRLNRVVESLAGLAEISRPEDQRARISEGLHDTIIKELREVLGLALANRNRVVVLVDNLDDPWGPGEHVEYLSELLLGLFKVAADLHEDFRRSDHWRKPVSFSSVVFIRSDIFFHVQKFATEQDKLPIQRVVWDDPELLARVIDERLLNSVQRKYSIDQVWGLFMPTIDGQPVKDFILGTTMARPRDVIYLVKEAVADAINAGHSTVTDGDFHRARDKYSDTVFTGILAEDDPERGMLESILYEFAGSPQVLTRSQVEEKIKLDGVGVDDVEFYFNLLCDVSFLGVETNDGLAFAHDEGDRQKLRRIARTLAERRGEEERYAINRAFHHALQVP